VAPKPVKFVLNWGRRYSLWVFNFGLACCAIEFIATSMSRHDFIRLGVIPFAPGPRQADLMVVSGTVSDKMAPAVKRLYEQMPEPKYVISFGACSNCGGPYWDSYCVTKGVDQIIPVDVYVPGCPPRPEALLHGIIRLQEKIAAESLGERYSGGGEPVTPAPAPQPLSATVLRRPLQPVPEVLEEADRPTQGLTILGDLGEDTAEGPAGDTAGDPAGETIGDASGDPAGNASGGRTRELPVLDEGRTEELRLPPHPEPPEPPEDGTTEDATPVAGTPVAGTPVARPPERGRRNGRPPFAGRRKRARAAEDDSPSDPSIIPGLGDDDDDQHDDEERP
jgi:NADH-quinone oxidoreductase B subunit